LQNNLLKNLTYKRQQQIKPDRLWVATQFTAMTIHISYYLRSMRQKEYNIFQDIIGPLRMGDIGLF